MVTEADWHTWSTEALSPYIETVLEAFTPKRIMFGSDWPVVNLASSYGRWIDTVRVAIAPLSATEQERILAGAGIEGYGLAWPDAIQYTHFCVVFFRARNFSKCSSAKSGLFSFL